MPTNIDKLLGAFQGNAYPAMLEVLAADLGVTAESLRRLALGWAPIVPFKRKTSFCGWWVVPERNADAVCTGLSLRNQDSDKTCYPGSKHGMIYEVNPDHEQGGATASPGDWIRTMEAGVVCPVCGKPDGCLVNSDSSNDPAGDAICIRHRQPIRLGDWVRPMKFGYLHSGRVHTRGTPALADNGGAVVVIEGMTDTAAAMDLGFNAIGRPSNLACMDILADLLRGRKQVIIVGENDKKPDGSHPGREGAIVAFQTAKRVVGDVTLLMPPEHVKDLRAWVAKFKLTRDEFIAAADKGEKAVEELVLPDDRPLTIARHYLDSSAKIGKRYTIRRFQGSWWRYTGEKYSEVDPEAFRAPIYPWSHDKQVRVVNASKGTETMTPLRCNTSMVANIEDAIMAETLIPAMNLPCWINGASGPETRDLIVFNNGILHVPSFLSGESESRYLLDSTPDLFTTVALPFAFDPTATCPTWKAFLRTSLGDDNDKIKLLREWFGYCLTPDTSMQKMMYLRGPTGAGKGTILDVIAWLVGEDQSASTSFKDLCGDFGLQALIGKQIAVIPDIRVSAKTDVMRGLELLLNITSGDAVQINRKFKDPMARYKLMTRVVIAGNDFIDVPDHAGAMVRRLNVLEFSNSFVGREDFGLKEKLRPEVPGIAVWALAGLRRLREVGQFTLPESSKRAMAEWRRSNSPLASFIDECTQPDPQGFVVQDELWDCWSKWSEERRIAPISKSRFLERMRSNAPHAIADCYDKGGHKFSVFRGLNMERLAARKFLGRPN
jgi:putative DNA primase/helicase